jgi:ferritin-like metal-binding protein YciE
MRAGGSGFVLFARSQVDTPGKLAAHAYSYEAMEWASYELLAKTAERAGEPDVARVARDIQAEERRMMERIESLFDQTAAASLEAGSDDLQVRLQRYLADAHAIEAQSLQLLHSGAGKMDSPTWKVLFEEHEEESRRQQELLEERIEAAGGKRSMLKDAAMRIGALEWGMFFGAQPDTPAKLAVFAYAFEHLEIGGYEQLRRVADRAADAETVRVVDQILGEERQAADRFAGAIDEALTAGFARSRTRSRGRRDAPPPEQPGTSRR